MRNDVNALHIEHEGKFKGYHRAENPFAPRKPRPRYGVVTKHIFILASQLFYDIDAETGLLSRARKNEQGGQDTSLATSEADTYRPMFFRWFDKYVRKAEGRMQAFLAKPVGVARMNDLREWEEKEIVLLMPDYWDDTCYDELVNAIHQYIVKGALFEYYKITLTSKDPVTVDTLAQADESYEDIKRCVCSTKPGSVKKTLKPF